LRLPFDPVLAARGLLGRELSTDFEGRLTSVVLIETEAYDGAADPASHAFRGRTARNGSMFGPPGTLYVYRSYGIHWCMNIVVGEEGNPGAVLLRAGIPRSGIDFMLERRGRTDHLVDGPGKLCQALGVTGDHDGSSVGDGPVRLGGRVARGEVIATPRIGISKATDRIWRFVLDPEDLHG
jgi:DNA-3-methyladenine glycosylase